MPRTWDRSRFAPWLLRELVQVNEEPTSRLCRPTYEYTDQCMGILNTVHDRRLL
jgi:hypothetical protein